MPVTMTVPEPAAEDVSFDELRAGFTASVSHELRTPLARILVLLDSADLPGADVDALLEQARAEVHNAEHADRRDPLPLRARERHRGRLARPHERAAGARAGDREARGARCTRGARAGRERRPERRPAAAAEHAADRRREPLRELDPVRRPRRHLHAVGHARARGERPQRRRRRDRRRRGRHRHGSSSASGAPMPPGRPAARVSASRSSSTSSWPPAARSRRPASRGHGLQIRCRFPDS